MATAVERIEQVAKYRHVARHMGIVVVALDGTDEFATQATAIDG
jgi:hypothetical protein